MSRWRLLCGLALSMAATAIDAQSPPPARVALLIGNAAYPDAALRNPVNDARTVATALREIGFSVTMRKNLKASEMRKALRSFVLNTRAAEVRLFYFAGHGLQMRGRNYLLPIDTTLASEKDVLAKTADATELVEQLGTIDNGANVIIIDACRVHPVFAVGSRKMWAAKPGLTQALAPRGTMVAFSTRPGKVARDGDGPTSVYTRHLVRELKVAPALPIEVFFKRVRSGVVVETQSEQVPWESSDIYGDVCFRPEANGLCKQFQ